MTPSEQFHREDCTQQQSPEYENPTNIADPRHPHNWSPVRKWTVFITTCYITFIVGLNATALTAVVEESNVAFGISDRNFPNSVWPVTAWNTGAALAPMFVLPIMEEYGVKPGYIVVYILFLLFVIPQAVAQGLATFIAGRFTAGCCGGVLQDVMDGIVADIWPEPVQRSLPVSMYILSLYTGVSIGPVVGGAIGANMDWRWVHYVQLIIYGGSVPVLVHVLRETRYGVIRTNSRTRKLVSSNPVNGHDQGLSLALKPTDTAAVLRSLQENVLRPFIFLVKEPIVFWLTLLAALAYGLLFLATQSVPQVYRELYGFDEPATGFIQGALVIGEVIGFLTCALISGPYFTRATTKSRDGRGTQIQKLPEYRLHVAVPCTFFGVGGGLLIYGWTAYPDIPYWAPATGLLLLGFGSTVIMQAIMMYITDAYLQYAASASAAVCFGENLAAAFLPLASWDMYTTLGFQWASSLLAILALALTLAPIILSRKGLAIRKRSPFLRAAMSSSDSHRT